MRYEVKLTIQAIEQIQEIVQYISKILFVPETAQKWLDSLQCESESWIPCHPAILLQRKNRGAQKEFAKCPLRIFLSII